MLVTVYPPIATIPRCHRGAPRERATFDPITVVAAGHIVQSGDFGTMNVPLDHAFNAETSCLARHRLFEIADELHGVSYFVLRKPQRPVRQVELSAGPMDKIIGFEHQSYSGVPALQWPVNSGSRCRMYLCVWTNRHWSPVPVGLNGAERGKEVGLVVGGQACFAWCVLLSQPRWMLE